MQTTTQQLVVLRVTVAKATATDAKVMESANWARARELPRTGLPKWVLLPRWKADAFLLLIVLLLESLSTTKRRLHQEARGASPGLSGSQRKLQSSPSRKLSTPRLYHQSPVSIIRIPRRSTPSTKQRWRPPARQGWTYATAGYLATVVGIGSSKSVAGWSQCQQPPSGFHSVWAVSWSNLFRISRYQPEARQDRIRRDDSVSGSLARTEYSFTTTSSVGMGDFILFFGRIWHDTGRLALHGFWRVHVSKALGWFSGGQPLYRTRLWIPWRRNWFQIRRGAHAVSNTNIRALENINYGGHSRRVSGNERKTPGERTLEISMAGVLQPPHGVSMHVLLLNLYQANVQALRPSFHRQPRRVG